MFLTEVGNFVRDIIRDDESLSTPNNCRNSTIQIKKKIEDKFPNANVNYLVYPKAEVGDGVHYALEVSDDHGEILINTVAAPGFPEYIGDKESAVPTFSAMKQTEKVK